MCTKLFEGKYYIIFSNLLTAKGSLLQLFEANFVITILNLTNFAYIHFQTLLVQILRAKR